MDTLRNAFSVMMEAEARSDEQLTEDIQKGTFNEKLAAEREDRLRAQIASLWAELRTLREKEKEKDKPRGLKATLRRGRAASSAGLEDSKKRPSKSKLGASREDGEDLHICAATQQLEVVQEQLAMKVGLVFEKLKHKLESFNESDRAVAPPMDADLRARLESREQELSDVLESVRVALVAKQADLDAEALERAKRRDDFYEREVRGLRAELVAAQAENESLREQVASSLAIAEEAKRKRDQAVAELADMQAEAEAAPRAAKATSGGQLHASDPSLFSTPQMLAYRQAVSHMKAVKERTQILKAWVSLTYEFPSWDHVEGTGECPFVAPRKGYRIEYGLGRVAKTARPFKWALVEPQKRVPYFSLYMDSKLPLQHFLGKSGNFYFLVTVEQATELNVGLPLIALVQTRRGVSRAALNLGDIRMHTNIKDLITVLQEGELAESDLFQVSDSAMQQLLSQQLSEFESMHMDINRKVGVLYWKAGQTENEAFSNDMSPALNAFCKVLGNRITLKGWGGFRGGLNVTNDETGKESVFARYKDFSIMYHVSALLNKDNSEQQLSRKRHIGNDLVVVVFWEGEGVFDVELVISQMCTVFIVVTPLSEDSYGVCVICKPGVPAFGPFLPTPAVLSGEELHEWLLIKIINGERAAFRSRVFESKTRTAREALLQKMHDEVCERVALKPVGALVNPSLVLRGDEPRAKCLKNILNPSTGTLELRKGDLVAIVSQRSDDIWEGVRLSAPYVRGEVAASSVQLVGAKERKRVGSRLSRPDLTSELRRHSVEEKFHFSVKLLSGTDLVVRDLLTSDPYARMCVVTANGKMQEQKSSVQSKQLNPVWNESFEFRASDIRWELFRIEIFDHDKIGVHKSMGYAEIKLDELRESKALRLKLESVKDENVSGHIDLEVEFFKEKAASPAMPALTIRKLSDSQQV